MTLAVYRYLREHHQLYVCELGAENVKIRAGAEDGEAIDGEDVAEPERKERVGRPWRRA